MRSTTTVSSNPAIMALWDQEANAAQNLSPIILGVSSRKQASFRCSKGHRFSARIEHVKSYPSCRVCKGSRASATTSIAAAYPEIAAQIVDSLGLDLSTALPKTKKEVVFLCDNGHEYRSTLHRRVSRGIGCPRCEANPRGDTISEDLLKEVHPDHIVDLRRARVGSCELVKWQCTSNSGHVWKDTFSSRSKGAGCPDCEQTAFQESRSLLALYPDVAALLSPSLMIDPAEVDPASREELPFMCEHGHTHTARVDKVVSGEAQCSTCSFSKGDQAVGRALTDASYDVPIDITKEASFEGLLSESENRLRYDYAFSFAGRPGSLFLIEFQGQHHYQAIKHFGGVERHEKIKDADRIKRNYAKKHGYPLLVISYKHSDHIPDIVNAFVKEQLAKLLTSK